ncbi:glycosyltransferase family 2 protein [Kineococcus gynurae]|uniref:Glycosyltransferase family 2 protein n=1 Tax=Kineococcus gynurae TaxID=452979 RepID=A0ABV5LNC4_9ACTN
MIAVLTIVAGRHDHLRGQLAGLARSRRRADLHVVVAMGDAGVAGVVAEFTAGSTAGRTIVVDVPVLDGELPLARARNTAARTAIGAGADLLVLLDVDCVPDAELLDAYARAATGPLVRGEGPALLCGAVTYLPPALDPPHYDRAELVARPHPARPDLPAGQVRAATADERWLFWSLSFAVTAADLERLGGFCEEYTGYGAEDTDLAAVLQQQGGTLFWVGGAHAFHQHHPTSRPPVQHLHAIVRNATVFHRRWGWFPMEGWLTAFRELGLADYDAASSTWSVRSAAPATTSR